jgi:hypothetical protein
MKIIKSILARLTDTSVTYSIVARPYEYEGKMYLGYLVYSDYFFLGIPCSKRMAICLSKEEAEECVQFLTA